MPLLTLPQPPALPATTATHPLSLLALTLILVPLLLRASVGSTTLPAWDMDPLLYSLPFTVLGPAASLLIDSLILLGAATLFFTYRTHTPDKRALILFFIGAAAILLHGWWLGPHSGTLHDQRIGASWLSALAAALALIHTRDPRLHRLTAATLLGFLSLLALRALQQEFIDHANTIADFKANRERIFAFHGWTPDSPMARSFERRALQPEATGWFGLSNVFASLAAAGTTLSLGLLITLLRCVPSSNPKSEIRNPKSALPTLALLLSLILSATALALTRSKGGILACAIGIATLFLLTFLRARLARSATVKQPTALRSQPAEQAIGTSPGRKPGETNAPTSKPAERATDDSQRTPDISTRTHSATSPLRHFATFLPITAILAPLLLLTLRGLLNDKLHELSLLFRWFYLQGATRIFLHHPLFGVGPDGFQNAYLIAKPPLSTEDVTSPHSILFDYAATLGILGLAWITLLFRLAWQLGLGINRATGCAVLRTAGADHPEHSVTRPELRTLIAIPALLTLLAAYTDSPLITPDLALLRVVGALLWILIAFASLRTVERIPDLRIPLAAAAIALLAHAQLEVTLSWPQSCGIVLLFISLALSPFSLAPGAVRGGDVRSEATDRGGVPRPPPISPLRHFATWPLLALALLIATTAALPACRWQNHLLQAANALRPAADIRQRLTDLPSSTKTIPPTDSIDRITRDLAQLLGRTTPINTDPPSINRALFDLESKLTDAAVAQLQLAKQTEPSDYRVHRELSRLYLRRAESAHAFGLAPVAIKADFDASLAALPGFRDFPSASDHRWRALVSERRFNILHEPAPDDYRRAALINYELAAHADPTNPEISLRLMRLYAAGATDPDSPDRSFAQHWAQESLRRDALQKYDPTIRALLPPDRAEAEKLAK